MPLTAYGQKKLGDLVLGIAAWTMPTTRLGIFRESPGENGSLTSEFTGGSYARQALAAAMGAADATTGISTSSSAITFPSNTANHGFAGWVGILDSATLGAGNVIAYTQLSNGRVINNGDPAVVIDAGRLVFSIVGAVSIMLTSYAMKKLVDHALGKSSYSLPTVYMGLLGSNPTIAGTQSSEVGVGAYVRRLLTSSMDAVDATSGLTTNNADIEFPDPTANYPDVNYAFGADAISAGNMLFATQLPSTLDINAGAAPVVFPAGSIDFGIA